MTDTGIEYSEPGDLGGLLMVIIFVGFAIVVALAPVRLLEGKAETKEEMFAGAVGLAIWAGAIAAVATML